MSARIASRVEEVRLLEDFGAGRAQSAGQIGGNIVEEAGPEEADDLLERPVRQFVERAPADDEPAGLSVHLRKHRLRGDHALQAIHGRGVHFAHRRSP
jgi:hypothetical protein